MIPPTAISPTGACLHVLADEQAWVDAVAAALIEAARDALDARSVFSLCLTGGSTPRALYEALGREPYRSALDWRRVRIFFGDERAVPPDHPASNYRMARDAWLDQSPIPAEAVFHMEGEAVGSPGGLEAAAESYAEVLARELPLGGEGFPSFDLLLLGMGGDGHTASLFPGTLALGERRRAVVVNEVPQLETRRLTLTFPALNAARQVWFLVTGEAKGERVAQALGYAAEGEKLPAACVRPDGPSAGQRSGQLHWWLDRAAAGQCSLD